MSAADPLRDDALKRIRDGNAQRNPCSGCGCVPVYRPDDAVQWHWFHREDCPVMQAIENRQNRPDEADEADEG